MASTTSWRKRRELLRVAILLGSVAISMLLASVLAPPFVVTAGTIGFVCSLLISFVVDRLVSNYRETIRTQNDRLSLQVTELEGLSAELAERNEEALAYARTVAHDLRNPLTVITSANELLKAHLLDHLPFEHGLAGRDKPEQAVLVTRLSHQEHPDHQEASKCIQPPRQTQSPAQLFLELSNTIATASLTMRSIISDLLSLADDPRKVDLSKPIDAHASARRAIEQLMAVAEKRKATIEIDQDWPSAQGYEPWLDRVWTNLLYNALKHGGPSPRIKIQAQRHCLDERKLVRFSVADNGPGIANAEQRRLFHEHPYSDRASQAHGLGLWIVRRIVERLDGKVGVDSTLGLGSTFWFDLVESHSQPEKTPDSTQAAQNLKATSPSFAVPFNPI